MEYAVIYWAIKDLDRAAEAPIAFAAPWTVPDLTQEPCTPMYKDSDDTEGCTSPVIWLVQGKGLK